MFLAKQISSLHKVLEFDSLSMNEIAKETVLRGERFTYQISMRSVLFLIRCHKPISLSCGLSAFLTVWQT